MAEYVNAIIRSCQRMHHLTVLLSIPEEWFKCSSGIKSLLYAVKSQSIHYIPKIILSFGVWRERNLLKNQLIFLVMLDAIVIRKQFFD